ncbi:hypothetical protein GE061_003818 [Apolygus lucorum]|uniref:Uncharacterized protein n=1 Tax=Apolygus lucorum TaxID=248454 RepID=A0A6A4JV09_APOLU|nr:hypothetical protein GE061_003818 [Apolygus lucorum]
MVFCNSACSLCCLVVSSWGIIQLVVMGIFYWFHAVALLEDIPIDESKHDMSAHEFYHEADIGYQTAAMNCWIAACLYILSFVVSGHQFYMNSRTHT